MMSMNESYLTLGIILTFPISFIYRSKLLKIYSARPIVKDVYFFTTGIGIFFLCFGISCLHALTCAVGSYLYARVMGVSSTSCIAIFSASMIHLLYGYITQSGISYTVTWTLIHCQMVMKVCGYYFDLYDAQVKYPKGFFPYLAYTCFPSTSLVGPIFSYDLYTKLTRSAREPSSDYFAKKRFGMGMIYIAIFYFFKLFWSTETLLSESFQQRDFITKFLFWTIWSKWLITKYCGVWLIAEAAASLTGLGEETEGSFQPVINLNVHKFETSLTIQDELSSFNVQVHQWVRKHVYKRCRVFNSQLLSRAISLLFLYLWHGIYFGFFNLFLIEGLGSMTETILARYVTFRRTAQYIPKTFLYPLLYILKNSCVGYGLCGFALRSFARCHEFYKSVYYVYHWLLLGIIIAGIPFNLLQRHEQKQEKQSWKPYTCDILRKPAKFSACVCNLVTFLHIIRSLDTDL